MKARLTDLALVTLAALLAVQLIASTRRANAERELIENLTASVQLQLLQQWNEATRTV